MTKSVFAEGREISLACRMISYGARLQVLEKETSLSYDRLSKLYKEIRGKAAPKGMLPFSCDWFMPWHPNVHATLFYSIYNYFITQTSLPPIEAIISAYGLYLEHDEVRSAKEPVLSFTRAWMLVRFVNNNMLQLSNCSECATKFITYANEPQSVFVCPLCRPPIRIMGSIRGETSRAKRGSKRKSDSAVHASMDA